MRSTKLNFSATILTLDLKAKIFVNLNLSSESLGVNCARARRFTAAWASTEGQVMHTAVKREDRRQFPPKLFLIKFPKMFALKPKVETVAKNLSFALRI